MNTEQEPQAQAEPEVVAYRNPTDLYSIIGKYEKENNTFQYTDEFLEAHNEELITLQSHREAIAKKDAALQAGVELMQYMRSVSSFERNGEIDAAITQAEEAQG